MTDQLLPAHRRGTARGLARLLAGLVLVALAVGCARGTDGNDDSAGSSPATTQTPTVLATPGPVAVTPKPDAVETVEQSEEPLPPDESNAKTLSGSFTLRIPRIDVTAPVVSIQSDDDRTLVPPQDPGLAGWWSQGARLGADAGSAIVVGHTVRSGGGVFDTMGELRAGDTVEVEGENSTMTYSVDSVDVLSVDDVANNAGELFRQDGPGRLVLVTCDDWDGTVWRSNIIAIATPA